MVLVVRIVGPSFALCAVLLLLEIARVRGVIQSLQHIEVAFRGLGAVGSRTNAIWPGATF